MWPYLVFLSNIIMVTHKEPRIIGRWYYEALTFFGEEKEIHHAWTQAKLLKSYLQKCHYIWEENKFDIRLFSTVDFTFDGLFWNHSISIHHLTARAISPSSNRLFLDGLFEVLSESEALFDLNQFLKLHLVESSDPEIWNGIFWSANQFFIGPITPTNELH